MLFMGNYYSSEKNVQILVALMKAHGIKKVIVNPGATNITLVQSLHNDSFFELISVVDERSAAYMACGLAEESSEPVALTCTGATASRNYVSALTEAFYRKLPILAITSTQHLGNIGQHTPQVIDRSNIMNDIAKISVNIPTIHDSKDEWAYTVSINKALLELKRNGGNPVHINLTTTYSKDYSIKELPPVKVINRICPKDAFPVIHHQKTAIFIGAHSKFNSELTNLIEDFCEKYNAVVIGDNTSNYKGRFWVNPNLIGMQYEKISPNKILDLIIHIGNVSGAYVKFNANEVWRVNIDGEVRDTFSHLTNVFEMDESDFFSYYTKIKENSENTFLGELETEYNYLYSKIPELPFSNIWIAKNSINKLPENSVVHFGILNTLRSWNFFDLPKSVLGYANTGGFGIDGCLSSFIGASLANQNKKYFGIFGDLSFFYDINSLANRHIQKNIRIMLINNGCGTEFKNFNHFAAILDEETKNYVAGYGHFGNQSENLVKHYAEDLGFTYISASNKEEYLKLTDTFFSPDDFDKPIIFEIFTKTDDESNALNLITHIDKKE